VLRLISSFTALALAALVFADTASVARLFRKPLCHLCQLLFKFFAVCDVTDEPGKNSAVREPHLAHGKIEREYRAVLASSHDLTYGNVRMQLMQV